MRKKILFVISITLSIISYCQNFTPSNEMVFESLTVSHSDVGDYDNDGDLDIIIMGLKSGVHHTKIYNNDGVGNYSLSSISLGENYRNGQVEFVDYDNDNDLDIFISGLIQSGAQKSALYQNNSNSFTEVLNTPFANNIINNQFSWGDLDKDGDLDLILTGGSSAYLYRNEGNTMFTSLSHPFPPNSQGKILIGDLDNDQDNDIIIAGLGSSGLNIYNNNGDFNFTLQLSLQNFFNGDMEIRDCDGNGFIDIIKNGNVGNSNSSKMYLNEGAFVFSEFTDTSFSPVGDESNFVSADYTGNGELDFLILGRTLPYIDLTFSTSIFENSGDLTFTENINTGIAEGSFDKVEIGDFDNDHDVDVFVINSAMANTFTNQVTIQNTIPNAPTNLQSQIVENNVTLSWLDGTDNESVSKFLSYNIYVGTTPGGTDIISPMADITTGYRKIVHIGNAQYKNQLALQNLEPGTYYWSVQSIDNQYEGSTFSNEQSFIISELGIDELDTLTSIHFYPNPIDNELNIEGETVISKVVVYNALGIELKSWNVASKLLTLDFSAFSSGIYLIKMSSENKSKVIKVVKKGS